MAKRGAILFLVVILALASARAVFGVDCLTISTSSSESDKNYCKKELAQIEAELAQLLKQQEAQRKNTGTLQGDINYLTSQINALKAKIKARSLAISQLKVSINEKSSTISSLEAKIRRQYESIAQLLRNTNEIDNENMIHLILSDQSVSDFYSDLESYSSIKEAVKTAVDELRGVKTLTESEKKNLE